jgi:hypothetical protein
MVQLSQSTSSSSATGFSSMSSDVAMNIQKNRKEDMINVIL